jgi:hypothetical protein
MGYFQGLSYIQSLGPLPLSGPVIIANERFKMAYMKLNEAPKSKT